MPMGLIRLNLSLRKYINFIKPSRSPNFLIKLYFDNFLVARIPKTNSVFQISFFFNVFRNKRTLIFFIKKIVKKSQNMLHCSIYACVQVKFTIFAICMPWNTVKNFLILLRTLWKGCSTLMHSSYWLQPWFSMACNSKEHKILRCVRVNFKFCPSAATLSAQVWTGEPFLARCYRC